MMTTMWSVFIVVLTLGTIALLMWLLFAVRGSSQDNGEGTSGHVWDDDLTELNNPLPKWWLNLFVLTIVFGLAYLALYPGLGNFQGVLGWSQQQQFTDEYAAMEARQKTQLADYINMDIDTLAQQTTAMQSASNLFANNCAVCHGSAGQGGIGFPNLTDNDWLYGDAPEVIQRNITHGLNGMMPALGLSDKQVNEYAHYVYGLSGRNANPILAEQGKANFALCAGCHGTDAKGNQVIGAPNLTDSIWLHGDGSLQGIRQILHEGKTNKMPAFNTLLTDIEIRLLTAYVTNL